MTRIIHKARAFFIWFPLASVAWFAGARPAAAQGPSSYTLLLGAGALCDGNGSSGCPVAAKSANGDVYELSGAGTFNAQSKSIVATGTFTHKSQRGIVLETGVWTAKELFSFEKHGFGPVSLPPNRVGSGPTVMAARNLPVSRLPMSVAAGVAIRVVFLPILGTPRAGSLQVNCSIREIRSDGQSDGVRLTLDRGSEFSEEEPGHAMILTMPSERFPTRSSIATGQTARAD